MSRSSSEKLGRSQIARQRSLSEPHSEKANTEWFTPEGEPMTVYKISKPCVRAFARGRGKSESENVRERKRLKFSILNLQVKDIYIKPLLFIQNN
jgi:hypothetical protein